MWTNRFARLWTVAVVALAVGSTGCATKKYVQAQVGSGVTDVETRLSTRIEGVETQVEEAQSLIATNDQQIQQVSGTAQDALDRAIAAGKLAEGKLLYETVLTDDEVRFGFDKALLSDEGRSALDEFANGLKTENANVYIEIQGHTDASGSEDYNLRLGEERAEAVRRYLSHEHAIPLHRMSVISYGESAPLTGNSTQEERSQNRRVSLVVLM